MSKELRVSIRTMPKQNRFEIGDDILKLLREIKVMLKFRDRIEGYSLDVELLYSKLLTLEVYLDECIEDGILLMKGKDNFKYLNKWFPYILIGNNYYKIICKKN